ncbi:MAG: LysR family transcriptional regulator, partial [Pseudomonadota bacterium]
MAFKSYDQLRAFTAVASHLSFTRAASELNLTKGAVSYQIKRLEDDLGFAVFERGKRGIVLTDRGERLLRTCRTALDDIESEIESLRRDDNKKITIGLTTYFASRWISPRLMGFTSQYPDVALRLQPTVG